MLQIQNLGWQKLIIFSAFREQKGEIIFEMLRRIRLF